MFMRAFISVLFLFALSVTSWAQFPAYFYPLDEFEAAPDRDAVRIGYSRIAGSGAFPPVNNLVFLGGKTLGKRLHVWGNGYANREMGSSIVIVNGDEYKMDYSALEAYVSGGFGAHAEPIERLQLFARAGYALYNIRQSRELLDSGNKSYSSSLDGYALSAGGSVFATEALTLSATAARIRLDEYAVNRFHVETSYRVLNNLKASAGILMSELQFFNERVGRTSAYQLMTPHARVEYRFSGAAGAFLEASKPLDDTTDDSSAVFSGGFSFFLR